MIKEKERSSTEVKSVVEIKSSSTLEQELLASLDSFPARDQAQMRKIITNDPSGYSFFHGLSHDNGSGGRPATSTELICFVRALEINRTLTGAMFYTSSVNEVAIQALAKALKVNRTLRQLYFSINTMDKELTTSLSEAFEKNSSLIRLHLRANLYSIDFAKMLLSTNRKSSCFYLDVSQFLMEDKGIISLAEELKINNWVTHLNLYLNKISDRGAQALAESLKFNHTLTDLNLHSNNISSVGGVAIANVLLTNSNLRRLNLSGNPIGNVGALVFAERLASDCSITHLALSYCNVDFSGMKALFNSLKNNHTLCELDLHDLCYNGKNNINDECMLVLAEVIKINRTLCRLFLMEKQTQSLSWQTKQIICTALANNYTLNFILITNSGRAPDWTVSYQQRNNGLVESLLTAIEKHDLVTLKRLLEQGVYARSNVNYISDSVSVWSQYIAKYGRYNPLLRAVEANNPAAVKILLQYDPFFQNPIEYDITREKLLWTLLEKRITVKS